MNKCGLCGEPLLTLEDRNKHMVKHREEMEKEQIPSRPKSLPLEPVPLPIQPTKQVVKQEVKVEKREAKPAKLKYIFEGECTVCYTAFETIVLTDVVKESKDTWFVIAWCPQCKVNRIQRTVAKL